MDAERSAEFSALRPKKAAATSLPEPSIHSFPLPECRDCCNEGQTRRCRRGERRCDPESVEQAAGDHVFCADQPMPVTRVPRKLSQWLQACHEELGQALVAGNESDGVEFSFVRWCIENVRVDGGHGAVRADIQEPQVLHPPLLILTNSPQRQVAGGMSRPSTRFGVEVAPNVVDATAVVSDTMDGENDLACSEAVPAFNPMDSDEEDEFGRTVVQSRSIEDAPRPPPDEEFFGPFSAMRTRRVRRRVQDSVSDAPERDGGRRPSRRVVSVPGSEEGAPQSIRDKVPSTVPASGMEFRRQHLQRR